MAFPFICSEMIVLVLHKTSQDLGEIEALGFVVPQYCSAYWVTTLLDVDIGGRAQPPIWISSFFEQNSLQAKHSFCSLCSLLLYAVMSECKRLSARILLWSWSVRQKKHGFFSLYSSCIYMLPDCKMWDAEAGTGIEIGEVFFILSSDLDICLGGFLYSI